MVSWSGGGVMRLRDLAPLANELHHVFHRGPGVFGKMFRDTPEYVHTRDVAPSDRLNFLTIVATMDYQTDAAKLWRVARDTYMDSDTKWLFDMESVARSTLKELKSAMAAHGFTGRYPANNARYVHVVCQTFAGRYDATPLKLLETFDFDAARLYSNRRRLGALPCLTGYKIFPFWLRMLKDVACIDLRNLDKVPLPVDVHTARATYRLIYKSNDKPRVDVDRKRIAEDWAHICSAARNPSVYPLALDEALWLLSREGCTGTDGSKSCPRVTECVTARHCIFGQESVRSR